ncbi:unnamed protein product, partial [Brugia timori]|uniref:UDP-3-O-(3-hydroxymyristoyl)glucosamine N-acyltransferase n=1 Tax=Brugia timori TaxID=42155 RepID=A0A0R3Q553_9BILA
AQITNSIICAGAEIGENANISSSIVVCQQIVSASGMSFKRFSKSAWMASGSIFIRKHWRGTKVHNELVVPNSEVELEKWTEEIW